MRFETAKVAMTRAVSNSARMIRFRFEQVLVGGDVFCKEFWPGDVLSLCLSAGRGDWWDCRLAHGPDGMPYYAEHFKAFPPEVSWARISIMPRMHPSMACVLARLIDDGIKTRGADKVRRIMDDENPLTVGFFETWLEHFGSGFPPSPRILAGEVSRRTRPDPGADSSESEEFLTEHRRSSSFSSSDSSSGDRFL